MDPFCVFSEIKMIMMIPGSNVSLFFPFVQRRIHFNLSFDKLIQSSTDIQTSAALFRDMQRIPE